jgi:O-antigen/teichoic acid export membrane protein
MGQQLRQLSRETAVLTAGNVLSLTLGLIGGIIIARALGDEARGLYAWVFTLQGFACQLAALATYHAARQIAAETPRTDWGALVISLAFLAGIGCLFSLPILGYSLMHPLGQAHPMLVILAFIGVPILAVVMPLTALLHVQGQAWQSFFSMVFLRLILLFATLGLWIGGSLNLINLTLANTLAALLTLGFLFSVLQLPRQKKVFEHAKQVVLRLKATIGAAWLAGLGLYALPKIALLVLATHGATQGNLAATGHLAVALTLFESAIGIPSLAAGVLVSHLTQNYADPKARRSITLGMVGLSALMALGGLLVGPWLIPVLFGSPFMGAVLPFQVFMGCLVLAALHQAWFSRLMHAQNPMILILPPLFGCAVVFGFGVLWVGPHGAFGAAMATFMGYGVLVLSTYALKGPH